MRNLFSQQYRKNQSSLAKSCTLNN